MKKSIVFLAVALLMTFLMSSCSFAIETVQSVVDAIELKRTMKRDHGDKYDLVEMGKDDTGEYLLYQGQVYRRDETQLFLTCFRDAENTDDVLISWSDHLYYYEYYADRAENPTYIYTSWYYCVYIRSDYDYTAETYTVENTDISFVLSEALTPISQEIGPFSKNGVTLTVYSVDCPKLRMTFTFDQKKGQWYAREEDTRSKYSVSDTLVEALRQNNIIP